MQFKKKHKKAQTLGLWLYPKIFVEIKYLNLFIFFVFFKSCYGHFDQHWLCVIAHVYQKAGAVSVQQSELSPPTLQA